MKEQKELSECWVPHSLVSKGEMETRSLNWEKGELTLTEHLLCDRLSVCTQSTKGLGRTKDWPPLQKNEFCQNTAFRFQLQHQLLSGSPVCPLTLHILDLIAFILAENFTHTHTLLVLFLQKTLIQTHNIMPAPRWLGGKESAFQEGNTH